MNRISIKNNTIDVAVSGYVYLDKDHPDGDIYIAYCPSLNLVGYGHGENAAKKGFVRLEMMFTICSNMMTKKGVP